MKNDNGDEPPRRRASITLCHEASHYILLEKKERKRLGLPHTKQNDIVNDWILAMGQHLGYPPPKRQFSAAGVACKTGPFDKDIAEILGEEIMKLIFVLGEWVEITDQAYQRIEYGRQRREQATGEPGTYDDIVIPLIRAFLSPCPEEMS